MKLRKITKRKLKCKHWSTKNRVNLNQNSYIVKTYIYIFQTIKKIGIIF